MLHWPHWVIDIVCTHWAALDAQALQRAVTASVAPHTKASDYRSLQHQLEAATAVLRSRVRHVVPPEPAVRDPQAAADYFRSLGIHVVESS